MGFFVVVLVALTQPWANPEDYAMMKETTVMGGPLDEESLMPCAGQCLCEVPIKPQPPFAPIVTLREVILTWGHVSETTYCDTATNVQMMFDGGGSWVTIFNGPGSNMTVTKIPVDTTVSFRIRERNCAGVGPFSDAYTVTTPTDQIRPLAPVVTAKTDHSLCLSWTPFADDNVTLSMRPVASEGEVEGFSPSWQVVYEGPLMEVCTDSLPSATYFQFRIIVVDSQMAEPMSESTVGKTDMEAPLAPLTPFLVASTDTTLSVRWTKPVSRTNRSPAQLFVVEVALVSTTDAFGTALIQLDLEVANMTLNATHAGNSTTNGTLMQGQYTYYRVAQVSANQALLTGLEPGTLYAIRARSVNAVGESDPSPALMVSTKPGLPGDVSSITFTSGTSDGVRLQWPQADNRGSPITAYEVQMSPGGSLAAFYPVYSGVTNRTSITGLAASSWYGFRIRALNIIGAGNWSSQYNIETAAAGQLISPSKLQAASTPMSRAALVTFLSQMDASETKHASQMNIQLGNEVSQMTLTSTGRSEPDLISDNLSGVEPITENNPTAASPIPEPVNIDGECALRSGCLSKDGILASGACPNDCHSSTSQGYCSADGVCHCATGWNGTDCGTPICVFACSDHGSCIGPGTCICALGYNDWQCGSYWTPVFHSNDIVTRSNVSTLRDSRLQSSNYVISANTGFPNLSGVLNMTQAPTVPHPTAPTHPVKRTIRSTIEREVPTTGTYFALPALSDFDFASNQSFTITLWAQMTAVGAAQGGMLLSHGNFQHGPGYGLGVLQGGHFFCGVGLNAFGFRASSLSVAVSEAVYNDDRFHHVACRYNPTALTLELFVDGNEVFLIQPFPWTGGNATVRSILDFSSLPPPETSAPDYPLVVGAAYDFQTAYFDGMISDIRLWRSIKSVDEIRASMWSPLMIVPPRLALYVPLNDCTRKVMMAYRSVGGRAQGITFPNTVSECRQMASPLVAPLFEAEDGVNLMPFL